MNEKPVIGWTPASVLGWWAAGLGCFGLLLVFIVVCVLGLNAFGRWQARADAHNNVSLTRIQVQNQRQYASVIRAHSSVVSAQAHQRYLQAIGIRAAQDEIRKTLTPLYIQHEAIQAEQDIANSGRNNTVIYVPAGQNGVPIVTPAGAGK